MGVDNGYGEFMGILGESGKLMMECDGSVGNMGV